MPKKKKNTGQTAKNADPIDEAYKNLTGKSGGKFAKKNSAPTGKIIVTVVVLIVICAAILGGLYFFNGGSAASLLSDRTVASGVTIAGVDVGGMTREEAIAAVNAELADAYSTETLVVTVLDRQWELTPALSGASLDVEDAVKEALDCGPQTEVDIIPYLNLNSDAIAADIGEFAKFFPTEGVQSGYEVVKADDGTEELVLTIGTEYYDFDATAFYTAVLDALNSGRFQLEYACTQMNISTIDLEAIYSGYCSDAVEATLVPNSTEVTQSSDGYRFDLEAATEALAIAQPGDVLTFPFQVVTPEMSTDTLKSMLFRDKLGSYTAYQASSSNRATNLRLACEALDGIILYPGDTFGYNATLGERTAAKGYKPAASYVGGETVDTYGGGICQPSSALYYACLIADLEIVQRSCHGFVSAYMPYGMDATVDWNGPDFKFKNSTDFPIRIDAKADGGTVVVTLVGTDTKDYYVEMEYEILSVSYPSVKEEIVEPGSGHYDGEVKTTAYTGYSVQTYKLKYDKNTDELISREKEAYSYYSRRDKVVYKIKQTDETTAPTEETTSPTESTNSGTRPSIGEATGSTEATQPSSETQSTTQATEATTQATQPPTTQATEATTQATVSTDPVGEGT